MKPLTWPHVRPNGIRPSRPIENMSLVVAPWIAIVQTKTAARTMAR